MKMDHKKKTKQNCVLLIFAENNGTETKMAYFPSVMNLNSCHCGCQSGFDCQLLNEPVSQRVEIHHWAEQQTDDVCFKDRY